MKIYLYISFLFLTIYNQAQSLHIPNYSKDVLKQTQDIADKSLAVEKIRMRVSTENAANAESAGYVAKEVITKTRYDSNTKISTVTVDSIQPMPKKQRRVYEPEHPKADAQGYVLYADIQELVEIMNVQTARDNISRILKVRGMATDLRHKSISLIER